MRTNIEKTEKRKMIVHLQTPTILDRKTCYQVWYIFKIILKILKNVTNVVKPEVKVEKSNCNRLPSRNKQKNRDQL